MSAEDWKALNRLLDEMLDLPPAERSAWIERLGPEHDALRTRLRDLLAGSSGPSPIDSLPHIDPGGAALHDLPDDSDSPRGGFVGPYRLVRRLAAGGMGTVWIAERADGLIARPVALKLPRGTWRGAALRERMARERDILSRLSHPHIGRLYDAGLTDDGQPYLALEFVEGREIDDYCAGHALDVESCLRLFLQVLDAVAHAHARLIVHRDLKPSNILVSDDGQVKLLDFGIAKLMTEGIAAGTELTQEAGRPLTPAYASPEQVRGEPLTTASDVFSLGIVLYELLAGARPEASGVARPVPDAAPPLPSVAAADPQRGARLRGDPDTIVMKALKREPEERYPTVNAFADDIRRYLEGFPILARPDSAWYRMSKFVRRHAVPVAAAAAAVLAIIIGAAAALWQARVALEAQQRAEEVKAFISSIFEGATPYAAAGQPLSAVDLLVQARRRIDRLDEATPELRVELLTLVGASLADLTEMSTAEPLLRETVDEAIRALGPDHELTLHARTVLAMTHRFIGDRERANDELLDLLPRLRSQAGMTEDLVEALESHASVAMDRARWDEAIASSSEMLDVARSRLGDRDPLTRSARWSLVQSYLLAGRTEEAADEADRVFPMMAEAYGRDPQAPELIEARELYGRVLTGVGRLHEGIDQIAQALDDAAAVFGERSIHIGFYAANLASRQLEVGDLEGALVNAEKSIEVSAILPGADSGLHAHAHHLRGQVLLASRRGAAALAQLDVAIEKLQSAGERSRMSVASTRTERALALAYTGRVEEALADLAEAGATPLSLRIRGSVERLAGDYDSALATGQQALDAIGSGPRTARARSMALTDIGLDLLHVERLDDAATALSEALSLSRSLNRRVTPEDADILVGLGRWQLASGRPGDAIPLLEDADGFWREFDRDNRWAGEAAFWLARSYAGAGRVEEAAAALGRARTVLSRSPLASDAALLRLASSKPPAQ